MANETIPILANITTTTHVPTAVPTQTVVQTSPATSPAGPPPYFGISLDMLIWLLIGVGVFIAIVFAIASVATRRTPVGGSFSQDLKYFHDADLIAVVEDLERRSLRIVPMRKTGSVYTSITSPTMILLPSETIDTLELYGRPAVYVVNVGGEYLIPDKPSHDMLLSLLLKSQKISGKGKIAYGDILLEISRKSGEIRGEITTADGEKIGITIERDDAIDLFKRHLMNTIATTFDGMSNVVRSAMKEAEKLGLYRGVELIAKTRFWITVLMIIGMIGIVLAIIFLVLGTPK